jgi:recombination protein RecA
MPKNQPENIVESINDAASKEIAFYGRDWKGQQIEVMPTGMLPLDYALGIGGLPVGRIIEMHGLQSVAKTSLSLGIIASLQQQGVPCAFVDAEYALNMNHARKIGVDTDGLLVVRADTGEEVFEAIEKIVRSDAAKFIVVDSVSALVTKAELENDVNKPTMGGQARLMANGLRRLVAPLAKHKCTIVFINQLRANMMGGQYDPYSIPGGMALRFYTTIILELKRGAALKKGETQVGIEVVINVKKNKVGTPNESCLVTFLFENGFSAEADILAIGEKAGVIQHEGNTYSFSGEKLGIGQSKAREYLTANPEVTAKILASIQEQQQLHSQS